MRQELPAQPLTYWRAVKKLTQKKLAEKAGISHRAYFNIENGKSVAKPTTRYMIANALELDIESIIWPMV